MVNIEAIAYIHLYIYNKGETDGRIRVDYWES